MLKQNCEKKNRFFYALEYLNHIDDVMFFFLFLWQVCVLFGFWFTSHKLQCFVWATGSAIVANNYNWFFGTTKKLQSAISDWTNHRINGQPFPKYYTKWHFILGNNSKCVAKHNTQFFFALLTLNEKKEVKLNNIEYRRSLVSIFRWKYRFHIKFHVFICVYERIWTHVFYSFVSFRCFVVRYQFVLVNLCIFLSR